MLQQKTKGDDNWKKISVFTYGRSAMILQAQLLYHNMTQIRLQKTDKNKGDRVCREDRMQRDERDTGKNDQGTSYAWVEISQ